jgi:hypothetical protein
MRRNLALACVLCFAATTVFAQSGFNGKWATGRPEDPQLITSARRAERVQLEVTVEGEKASGTLAFGGIGGRFDTFKDGKVSGNRLQFSTANREPNPQTKWTVELVDENTVTISRAPLQFVGTNILDLIAVLGGQSQPPTAPKVAAVGLPVAPTVTIPQGANAQIRGIVQDRSRAFIPGVKVTATNVDTGETLTAMTDEAGRYAFSGVMRGPYTLTASLPGFQTSRVNNLTIGDTQLLQDFTLEVGMAQAYSHPPVASCGAPGTIWCVVLHRTK